MLRTQQTEAQVVAGMAALQREHASDKEMIHAMQQQQDMMNGMHQATTSDLTVFERDLEAYEHVSRQLASACIDIHHVCCVYVHCLSLAGACGFICGYYCHQAVSCSPSLSRSLPLSLSLPP